MTKLEQLKASHEFLPDSHFKASIYLGWKKLNKYYALSDTTAAYRAAIVIHPSLKMRWFESKWSRSHPEWIATARSAIQGLYNDYKQRHSHEALQPSQPSKERSEFEQYNDLEDDYDCTDDLERFLREERTPKGTNPLDWWLQNNTRYPVLRYMAFDLLTTPASSSLDERTFSKADWSVNNKRYSTEASFIEYNQCLKNWIDEGLIYNHHKAHKTDTYSQSSQSG